MTLDLKLLLRGSLSFFQSRTCGEMASFRVVKPEKSRQRTRQSNESQASNLREAWSFQLIPASGLDSTSLQYLSCPSYDPSVQLHLFQRCGLAPPRAYEAVFGRPSMVIIRVHVPLVLLVFAASTELLAQSWNGRFRNGPSPALRDGKWGFVDRHRNFVIEPRFDSAAPFSSGLSAVRVGEKYGYIDRRGREVIEPKYSWAGEFSEQLAAVRADRETESFSYIDRDGKKQLEVLAERAGPFSDGFAAIRRDGLYGYIDRKGATAIPPKYELARRFLQKRAAIKLDGRFGFIDPNGTPVVAATFDAVGDFHDGRAWVRMEGKYGYVDRQGKAVTPIQYAGAFPFVHDVAAVRMDRKYGFIDLNGKLVVDYKYDAIDSYDPRWIEARIGKTSFLGDLQESGLNFFDRPTKNDWYAEIRFVSVPQGATVYRIPLWEYNHNDLDSLLNDEHVIPKGSTDLSYRLEKFQEYRIVFVKDAKRIVRPCVPQRDPEIKVEFK